MEERRRIPRQHVSWSGKCVLDSGPGTAWIECHVIDVSPAGVGLEVFGARATDFTNRRIAVEIHAPAGTSVTLHLVGQVRNAVPRPQGGIRVGVELGQLAEPHRSVLDALLQIAR